MRRSWITTTLAISPVMWRARSEARKAIGQAMSSEVSAPA